MLTDQDRQHFQSQFIQMNDDVRYHVLVAPPRDRASVLILHGFTGSHLSNLPLARALREAGFGIILPDLLGHGLSDAPAEPARYAMPHAANDLLSICDAIDPSEVHLVGYSMGGRLALYLALHDAERWRSLVLESSTAGIEDAQERAQRRASDETLATNIETKGIAWFVDYWDSLPLWSHQTSEQREALRQQRLNNHPRGLAHSLRGMGTGAQPPLWDQLAGVRCPSLLMAGEHDRKFVALAQRLQAGIPSAQFRLIAQAGHAVHVEQSAIFQRQVLGFLADCE